MALSRITSGGTLGAAGLQTSLSLTWPTGVASTHFAVVVVSIWENFNDVTVNAPSGAWGSFTNRSPTAGDLITGSGNTETRSWVFTRECSGSESGSFSITNSGGSSIYWSAVLDVYSGTNDLTYASISSPDIGASTATDATAPSVTGSDGQGLLCLFALSDGPGTTNSGPSGMTMGSDKTDDTNGCRVYYQDLTGGATGTKTWDYTNQRASAGYSLLIDGASNASAGTSSTTFNIFNQIKRTYRPRPYGPGRGR